MIGRTLKTVLVTGMLVVAVFVGMGNFQALRKLDLVPLSEQQVENIADRAEYMHELTQGEQIGK